MSKTTSKPTKKEIDEAFIKYKNHFGELFIFTRGMNINEIPAYVDEAIKADTLFEDLRPEKYSPPIHMVT